VLHSCGQIRTWQLSIQYIFSLGLSLLMKSLNKKLITFVILTSFSFSNFFVHAAQIPSNISPQQIKQFQSLPPAQQKVLAQSMGIDINAIKSQLKNGSRTSIEEEKELPQYHERGTEFDEFGNPIATDKDIGIEKESNELKAFGYDVFANEPSSFSSLSDVAVPDNYVLGVGDSLNIEVFGKENSSYELSISREGKVFLPELGSYSISGMEFYEAKEYLKHKIKNKIIGVDVVISLSELRSIRVFVLGEAYKPGNYTLNSLSSITHAIFAAGGISDIGSLRNIELKRAGKLITTLDLYDLLIKGDSSSDLLLKSGDVVFISPIGDQVKIDGAVKRPAIYELKGKENFASILTLAGGLSPEAFPKSTIVERYTNSLRSILNVDLSNDYELSRVVQAGDYIKVKETSDNIQQSVAIIGAVTRPGIYAWNANQKVTDLLPNIESYLLGNADLFYSLIVRQAKGNRDIKVIQFSLKKAITNQNSQDNVLLMPQDKLFVFSNDTMLKQDLESLNELISKQAKPKLTQLSEGEYDTLDDGTEVGVFSREKLLSLILNDLEQQAVSGEPIKIVEIDGAIKYPGHYPLPDGGSVDTLIAAAGGLLESAFLTRAEMSRINISGSATQTEIININLLDVLNNKENILLQSKDRLNINSIPSWQDEKTIELIGEFKFPGRYSIRRGETLSQIIERAGGFTEYANIKASLFTREKLKEIETQNLIKVSDNLRTEIASKSLASRDGGQGIDYQQANVLLDDLTKVEPVGRLVIDINSILSGKSADIFIEANDVLYVAPKQNTINVAGQVHAATAHLFRPELTVTDYVALSGGLKQQADEGRIYIIKANGAVEIPHNDNWFSDKSSILEAGDTVVIPLDTYYMDDITLWQTATQIVYQSAVALAAVSGL